MNLDQLLQNAETRIYKAVFPNNTDRGTAQTKIIIL